MTSRTRTAFRLVGALAMTALMAAACSSEDRPGESIGRVGEAWTNGIPPCGTGIGSWSGITAYSNGTCFGNINCVNCDGQGFNVHTSSNGATAYGGAWQCVELITRYLDTTYGIWLSNNAGTPLCNSAASTGGLTVYGPGYNNSSPPEPVAGDALVWNYNGGVGHTALATGSSGGTITYLEQNWGNTTGYAATGTTPWNGSNFGAPSDSLGGFTPACWIHVNANSAMTCPYGNGLYCGGNGVMGDPNTLYQCTNGTLTVVQVCPYGCQHEPVGQNDQCAAAPPPDAGTTADSGAPQSDASTPDAGARDSGRADSGHAASDAGVAPTLDASGFGSPDTGAPVPPQPEAGGAGDTGGTGDGGGCSMTHAPAAPGSAFPLLLALGALATSRRREPRTRRPLSGSRGSRDS